MNKAIILFDGVCNLCAGSVQFVIARDPAGYFQFAALQSAVGQQMLGEHGISNAALASVVLIENGQVYQQSDAALRVARHLTGWWPLLSRLSIIPRPIRDAVYDWVAANRYRWFGRQENCMLPTPDLRRRFLG